MKYKYITSILIIGFILTISIMSIITPDKEISEVEGITLQQPPTPKNINDKNLYKEEIMNGQLFIKWDNYFSDHIYNRNEMVDVYTKLQARLNKKYINEVYIGKDGELIKSSNYNDYNENELKERADNFNEFAKVFKESKNYIATISNKNHAYENKMPIQDYKSGQGIYLDKIMYSIDKNYMNVINLSDNMQGDNLYYKTDHHMNMNGVFNVYKNIVQEINKSLPQIGKAQEKDDFKIETFKNVFIGSYGRQVLQVVDKMDDIEIYKDKNFENYTVKNKWGEDKLFYEEKISKDKLNNDYDIYLGGDQPKVEIENQQSKNNLEVVIIGDSMDNPLISLLASHFKKTYSYDLRYYKEDIVSEIKSINPDVILMIGASSNFVNKTEIFNWKREE